MAKSLKSLLSKINLVDLVVFLVLVAVMICLMKKMDVVEGLCGVNRDNLDQMKMIPADQWNHTQDWDGGTALRPGEDYDTELNRNPNIENLEQWATESCSSFSDSQEECEMYFWNSLRNKAIDSGVNFHDICTQRQFLNRRYETRTYCPEYNRCTWTPDHRCTSSQAVLDGPDFEPGEGLELVNIKFENEARCNQIDNMDDCRRVDTCTWV